MKILVVLPNLKRGGAERVVSLLTQQWAQQHEVVTVLFDGRDAAYAHGGRLVDLERPPARATIARAVQWLMRAELLRRVINRERPDRIFSFLEIANFPAILASAASGTLPRLAVSVRNNPERFPAAQRLLMRMLYRMPHKVVAVSAGVAERLEAGFGLSSAKTSVIPNPVDLELIEAGRREPPSNTVVPAGRRFILGVGRLVHQKGFDLLIEAYAEVSPDFDVDLVILGEGPDRNALEGLVRKLGLTHRVFLPGAMTNPFAFMARARVFVLSSRWEGWPNALVEAMATGAAVAAFDCPCGPSEIIEDRVSGAIVAAQDQQALADALRELLANDSLRASFGQRAEAAVSKYSVEGVAQLWLRLV